MTARKGSVWYEDQRVGSLGADERGTLQFAYDSDWLAGDCFPVSISLPLSNADREVPAHGFFEGLLPEGAARQRICRQHGIAVEDDAGLLFAIGGDCAGALSILPEGVVPGDVTDDVTIVTDVDLAELVRSAGTSPVVVRGQDRRFSLAGAHEKLPVIVDGAKIALSDTAHPSSHILKFETVPWVCFSEAVTNRIAGGLELPVVDTEFHELTGGEDEEQPYLLITRYDREIAEDGHRRRIHQEDMAQALGLPSSMKYQRDGGPSLGEITELVRDQVARPVEAVAQIRDWQIFNVLVGNWDGHAKNLSFLHQRGEGAGLAPFYDLVSIEFFNLLRPGSFSRDLAFSVGTAVQTERIRKADWEAFAAAMGMPKSRLLARVRELVERLPTIAEQSVTAFQEAHREITVADRLVETVNRRCRWTLDTIT